MDPQAYQPLSQAFIPPTTATGARTQYSYPAPAPAPSTAEVHEEEEEEEEEDDDDEGRVEEQLNMNQGEAASPKPTSPVPETTSAAAPEVKRKPGRPRGSKNRKPRVAFGKADGQFYYPAPAGPTTTAAAGQIPQHPNVNASNQQYYEFQWRVLNLCGEFYAAAEELVKGTAPLVIAQCYHMGPGIKLDPLAMLAEAKRVCDALLSNPSQLILNPPPPMYPVLPTLYSLSAPQAMPAAPAPIAPPAASGATVITNPQSFSVPLGHQHGYNPYPVYAPAPGQYPTTPYFQYPPYSQAGPYYPPAPPPVMQPSVSAGPVASASTSQSAAASSVVSNQGAWSEEETERLRKLAEDSKAHGTSGEIEWDWVKTQWGNTRTKHQILIKATNMGLKESSTRASKRRRENDNEPAGSTPAPAMASLQAPPQAQPQPQAQAQQPPITTVSSPTQSVSQAASTPAASPALQNLQRPPSSAKTPSSLSQPPQQQAAAQPPWPMPTVAAVDGNAASPVLGTTPTVAVAQVPPAATDQRANYYRPRPAQAQAPEGQPAVAAVTATPQQLHPQQHANPHQYTHQQQYQQHQWYNSSGARS